MKRLFFFSSLLFASFGIGWNTANLNRDKQELAVLRTATLAAQNAQEEIQAISSQSARALEQKLETLKHAMPEAIRAESSKAVFYTVCVSDDFVRMYNDWSNNVQRTLSGESENTLPDDITAVNGQ